MTDYVILNKIYHFLIMKEAFEAGIITAESWKEIIAELIAPMIVGCKKGTNEEREDE